MLTPYELIWLFGAPAALFSWYHIVKNISGFLPPQEPLPHNPHPKIVFSIAARRLTPSLQVSVDSVKSSCEKAGFTNYEIKVVVDEIKGTVQGAETILVPPDFVSQSRYKARALHYALRFLPNSKDAWILHLDEDAQVTPQCVSQILLYIDKGGKPVANGPSLFPYDGNPITFYAEAQRHWTFYWLKDQVNTSTVHWLNGSNLLVRSDFEQTMGWDFAKCFISEDARFGYEATKKFGDVFGWHNGLTIETPPASIDGLIKQRRRWFYGSIFNLRFVPRSRLPRRIYSITAWLDGLFLTLFFFFLLTGLFNRYLFSNEYVLRAMQVAAVLWMARYQIGVYQNLRVSPIKWYRKLLLHLGIIPLAPVVDFLCNIPTTIALVRPPRSFEITAKKE